MSNHPGERVQRSLVIVNDEGRLLVQPLHDSDKIAMAQVRIWAELYSHIETPVSMWVQVATPVREVKGEWNRGS